MTTGYQQELAYIFFEEFRRTKVVSDYLWKLYKYDCRAGGHATRSRAALTDQLRWAIG